MPIKVFGIKALTAVEVPAFVANAGFDGLFIDLEHSQLPLKTANELCINAMRAGISPFVRVPGRSGPGFVQRVLDGGAQGVIFPHVDTVGMRDTIRLDGDFFFFLGRTS